MLALSSSARPRLALASLARVAAHRRTITSSIRELQAAFKDPSSPFHLPPGTQGPDSPDSPPVRGAHAQRDDTNTMDIPIPTPTPIPTRPLTANAYPNLNPNPNQVDASSPNANQGAAVIAHSDSHVQADDTSVNVTPTDKITHAHVSPAQLQQMQHQVQVQVQDKLRVQDKPQPQPQAAVNDSTKNKNNNSNDNENANENANGNDITSPPERAEQAPGVVLGTRSVSASPSPSAYAKTSLSDSDSEPLSASAPAPESAPAPAPASSSEALAQAGPARAWSRAAAMRRAGSNRGSSADNLDDAGALADARAALIKAGLDPASFWEQRIVWGDQDSFQHVNNVRYVRFFESARIKWLESLGTELGGRERAEAMIRGQGVSLILKSIEVRFRRPVTYPDTLVIGYKPVLPSRPASSVLSVPSELSAPVGRGECQEMGYGSAGSGRDGGNGDDRTTFAVEGRAWSVRQGAFVAHAKEALVWYDYGALRKCDPGEAAWRVVAGRVQ